MYTTKQVYNFKRRIMNARSSFGVMTDMMLELDIDAMSDDQANYMYDALADKSIGYNYLTLKVNAIADKEFDNAAMVTPHFELRGSND